MGAPEGEVLGFTVGSAVKVASVGRLEGLSEGFKVEVGVDVGELDSSGAPTVGATVFSVVGSKVVFNGIDTEGVRDVLSEGASEPFSKDGLIVTFNPSSCAVD